VLAVLVIVLLLLALPMATPQNYLEVSDAQFTPQAIAASNISVTTAKEYEPIWVQSRPQTPALEAITLLEGKGTLLSTRLSPTLIEAQTDSSQLAKLSVNVFYFPGWTVRVDEIEQPTDISDPEGVITFSLSPGRHLIRVTFEDTPIRRWSSWLSWLSLLVLVLSAAWPRLYRYLFSKKQEHLAV
jgi:hypothetical protein